METKFDFTFFNVDPYKNHLEAESKKDKLAFCSLLFSLCRLALDEGYEAACRGHSDNFFSLSPLSQLFVHLDEYADYKNDSGLETDDETDYPLDYKPPSRAPGPHTTWHGRRTAH